MILSDTTNAVATNDLTKLVARKLKVAPDMVLSFADATDFVTELLKMNYQPACRLLVAGHATPELAIAADRAEIHLVEVIGKSPFSSDTNKVLEAVSSPKEIIYISNPNRVTGTSFSLADIEGLAEGVEEGVVIVDEYYFDHLGISTLPLLDKFSNIVVIRSFTSAFGITSSDTGYAVASARRIRQIKSFIPVQNLSAPARRMALTAMVNEDALSRRLEEVREEALRLATDLNRRGVQCRITAADFLLLRVKDPKSVGNLLASYRVPIDNLDGYPGLKHYIRYRLQSSRSNDRLLEAFEKMPQSYYAMKAPDLRAYTLRRSAEGAQSSEQTMRTRRQETPRSKTYEKREKQLKSVSEALSKRRKQKLTEVS
jgi:histidinol-phosphate aminotransferase